ncbi:MAG: peptidylprolyl isomerase [Candidatus Electryonea clarkiae]|nr:peptidylprolyl isomerase [Candidatus Electryonea clarkiae]
MRNAIALLIGSIVITVITGCSGSRSNKVAVVETDLGNFTFMFYPEAAPNHVNRFIELAQSGFYDGLLFHRVIPEFIIQTGDPQTRDPNASRSRYGSGGSGVKLEQEFNDHIHERGTVGMARTADPFSEDSLFYNSADSQFYICLSRKSHLDGKYTVFGEVLEGMEVVDAISSVERDVLNAPISPVAIHNVKIQSLKAFERKQKEKQSVEKI